MDIQKCRICNNRDANHKNSHLIPSFLTARIFNPDGANKRDKGITFTITDRKVDVSIKGLKDTDYERLFEAEPSDERIRNELAKEAGAVSNIFCCQCENDMSNCIESQYAELFSRHRETDGTLGYIFWASIIWRLAIAHCIETRWIKGIPEETIDGIGEQVKQYIKNKKDCTRFVLKNALFSYRIIRNDETGGQFIYGINDSANGHYLIAIGAIKVLFDFFGKNIAKDSELKSFNTFFEKAPINNGTGIEDILGLTNEENINLEKIIVSHAIKQKEKADCDFLDEFWNKLNLKGNCPVEIKAEYFNRMYSDKIKIGDRHTLENKINVIKQIFIDFGLVKPE